MKWYTWLIILLIVANAIALAVYVGSQPPPTIIVCTNYQPEYIQPGMPQKVGVWCFEERDL